MEEFRLTSSLGLKDLGEPLLCGCSNLATRGGREDLSAQIYRDKGHLLSKHFLASTLGLQS